MENTEEHKRRFAEAMAILARKLRRRTLEAGAPIPFVASRLPHRSRGTNGYAAPGRASTHACPPRPKCLSTWVRAPWKIGPTIEAAKVLKAIGDVGGYQSVVFDDPVTMAVIHGSYGGWRLLSARRRLRPTPGGSGSSLARRMRRIPAGTSKSSATCRGNWKLMRRPASHCTPKPVLIGDQGRAGGGPGSREESGPGVS